MHISSESKLHRGSQISNLTSHLNRNKHAATTSVWDTKFVVTSFPRNQNHSMSCWEPTIGQDAENGEEMWAKSRGVDS